MIGKKKISTMLASGTHCPDGGGSSRTTGPKPAANRPVRQHRLVRQQRQLTVAGHPNVSITEDMEVEACVGCIPLRAARELHLRVEQNPGVVYSAN
jgi:hypothetical protein